MTTFSQRSFSAGEIAPALYARVDTLKYATGARQMRNSLIMRHGGSQNRPGFDFVCETKDSTKKSRLIEFIFNAQQTYMLEFGNQYMRVIKDGLQLADISIPITGITNANPAVVSYSGVDPANGQEIYIAEVEGDLGLFLNNRNFKISNVNTGANTFELQDMSGASFSTVGLDAYTGGGFGDRVYEIATPYLEADLFDLQYVQSADVVTIVHPNYEPRNLSRTSDTAWTLETVDFVPGIERPDMQPIIIYPTGSILFKYRVTAVAADTYEESFPSYGYGQAVNSITNANPAVISQFNHRYDDGDEIIFRGMVGMTELDEKIYYVANKTTSTYEIKDADGNLIDSTLFGVFVSGSSQTTYSKSNGNDVLADTPTPADPIVLVWSSVPGAIEYNVYRELNGVYGFIGIAKDNGGTVSFNDVGVDADTTDTPPNLRNPFNSPGNYPSTVTYFQQRRMFANTDNDPEKVFGSKTGQFTNFTTASPIQDDDAITFTVVGRQVNEVQHLIDLNRLIIFTTGGELSAEGGADGVLRPGEINIKQYSYNGSSRLAPIVSGGNALYVQARGSIVRDLGFDFQADGYRGNDLTIFSAHLFEGVTLADWTYQQIPQSIIWIARSDGMLLGLTYVREQQIVGWHRHDSDGKFESVRTIPEGLEDALYVIVNRTIDGVQKRYIERMNTRLVENNTDFVFMDSAQHYDGRNTGSTTMTLSGGSTWGYLETITLTASASTFDAGSVGNSVHLFTAAGEIVRFKINAYVSPTVVTGKPDRTVPLILRGAPRQTWSMALSTLSGLWAIEGKSVSILGDGNVIASPNNADYVMKTVIDGQIDFGDSSYAVIHVGLPYMSDIETLDIDTAQGETLVDKKKNIGMVTLYCEKSRGGFVGTKPPIDDSDDPLQGLYELKVRNEEGYDDPVRLLTGTVDVNVESSWNQGGRVFIRQVDPLPLSVLAVAPRGLIPVKGG